VIEDAMNGLQAAHAAGMRCIAVAHTFPAGQLQAADVVRDKIAQVRLSDIDPQPAGQFDLPHSLPAPVDDGACQHLVGMTLPSITLLSTAGRRVDVSQLAGRVVVYCYPRTGQPGEEVPAAWDEIPGARGCTPQACAFRDHYAELRALDTQVFGLSTQDTAYQREAAERLHLPFELLSDTALEFASRLQLPTFEFEGMTLIKRLTLIATNGRIEKVFYPVFPPDKNAAEVIDWLRRAK
jgi:peroxiredoxin